MISDLLQQQEQNMDKDAKPNQGDKALVNNKLFLFMYGSLGLGVIIWVLLVVMNIFILRHFMSYTELIVTLIVLLVIGYLISYYKARSGRLGFVLRRFRGKISAPGSGRLLTSSIVGAIVMLALSYLLKLIWADHLPSTMSFSLIAFIAYFVVFYLWQLWIYYIIKVFVTHD